MDDAEAVTALLYESSPEIYDRFAGNRERAMRILAEAFAAEGNVASAEVVWLAEAEDRPVAAMAAFPIAEGPERARAFTRLALRRVPFWLWGRTLRLYTAGTRAPRDQSLYVDALATDPGFRRRGAARALLAAAEHEARQRSLF
jgi:GNAT superfamily N-acetyltransferase